jgi:hypothetical protein
MFGVKADDSHISSFVETGTSGILFVHAQAQVDASADETPISRYRYYEYADDELFYLNEHKSADPRTSARLRRYHI